MKNVEILVIENLDINKMKYFIEKNGKSFYNFNINDFEKVVNMKKLFNKFSFRIYKKVDYIKIVISLKF